MVQRQGAALLQRHAHLNKQEHFSSYCVSVSAAMDIPFVCFHTMLHILTGQTGTEIISQNTLCNMEIIEGKSMTATCTNRGKSFPIKVLTSALIRVSVRLSIWEYLSNTSMRPSRHLPEGLGQLQVWQAGEMPLPFIVSEFGKLFVGFGRGSTPRNCHQCWWVFTGSICPHSRGV